MNKKMLMVLILFFFSTVLIGGVEAKVEKMGEDFLKQKIVDPSQNCLYVYSPLSSFPTVSHVYNPTKSYGFRPVWDLTSVKWMLSHRCVEVQQFPNFHNATVLVDLGMCNYDIEVYNSNLEKIPKSCLASIPEYKCMVGDCSKSGWKDNLYTYTYKKVVGSERKCWKIFSSKFCWNAPVTEEVTEKHTLPDWTRKAREYFNNENITEEEVLKELTK